MKKKLALAAVVLAAAGLITAGIAPAQATDAPTLPAGQHFFAASCDGAVSPQLTSVDTTNGNATYVGNAINNNSDCPSNAAVNPADGLVYMAYAAYDPSFVPNLAKVDPVTGVYTLAPISGYSGYLWGFSITKDGTGYFRSASTLYSLDLTTAVATAVGTGLGLSPDMMGYNPVDGTFYAFDYDFGSSTLLAYTVDTSTGVATADPSHNITMADYSVDTYTGCNLNSLEGVAFDGNGNPWFVSDSCSAADLVVADFATGAASFVALITNSTINPDSPHDFYTESIFITGTPTAALPDTGASAIALVSTGAIAAGLLGAGALALIMVRRRQAGK